MKCHDCGEYSHLAIFKDRYTCIHCGVYDDETGEV